MTKLASLLLLAALAFAAGAALARHQREPPPEPVLLRQVPEQFPGEGEGKWT